MIGPSHVLFSGKRKCRRIYKYEDCDVARGLESEAARIEDINADVDLATPGAGLLIAIVDLDCLRIRLRCRASSKVHVVP